MKIFTGKFTFDGKEDFMEMVWCPEMNDYIIYSVAICKVCGRCSHE